MKFSIPYNGSDPSEYLKMIEPYRNQIHDVFFSQYNLLNHQQHDIQRNLNEIIQTNPTIAQYESNVVEFLKKSYGKYKRYITMNNAYIPLTNDELFNEIKKLRVYIINNKIDGVIVSEYDQAQMIHMLIPEVELCTSCNSYHTNIRTMKFFKDQGVTLFNPPREYSRSIKNLIRLKDFKLKIIVNEACLYGCPKCITHSIDCSFGYKGYLYNCIINDLSDIFKSNFILPRWLSKLEKYVDVFKIAGRFLPNEKLKIIFDAYFNQRDDLLLTDFLVNGTIRQLKHINEFRLNNGKSPINIYSYDVPDKVLFCECKCDNCTICSDKLREILSQ